MSPSQSQSNPKGAGPKQVKNKKARMNGGPSVEGTHKAFASNTHGFKGGGGFGYVGSMMGGRSR